MSWYYKQKGKESSQWTRGQWIPRTGRLRLLSKLRQIWRKLEFSVHPPSQFSTTLLDCLYFYSMILCKLLLKTTRKTWTKRTKTWDILKAKIVQVYWRFSRVPFQSIMLFIQTHVSLHFIEYILNLCDSFKLPVEARYLAIEIYDRFVFCILLDINFYDYKQFCIYIFLL